MLAQAAVPAACICWKNRDASPIPPGKEDAVNSMATFQALAAQREAIQAFLVSGRRAGTRFMLPGVGGRGRQSCPSWSCWLWEGPGVGTRHLKEQWSPPGCGARARWALSDGMKPRQSPFQVCAPGHSSAGSTERVGSSPSPKQLPWPKLEPLPGGFSLTQASPSAAPDSRMPGGG